jgi:hypothetical protein
LQTSCPRHRVLLCADLPVSLSSGDQAFSILM